MRSIFLTLPLLAACAASAVPPTVEDWRDTRRQPGAPPRSVALLDEADGRCRAQAAPIFTQGALAPPHMRRVAADAAVSAFRGCMAGEGWTRLR